ncbi:MAG: DUF6056 family protein [Pseudoflavonifractor sp.]|nr:DUF6056 family protein [Pseudoflavonifractor sp.]
MAWRYNCFPYSDDLPYTLWLQNPSGEEFWTCSSHIEITTYKQAFESAYNHYVSAVGRLSNLVHILFRPLPDTVEQTVIGLFCISLILLIILVCYGRNGLRSPFAVAAAIVGILTFLPWEDKMTSDVFAMNYVASSVIVLTFIFMYGKLMTQGGWSKLQLGVLVIIGLMGGWWHEGFAIPTIVASTVIAWQHRGTLIRNKTYVLPLVAMIIGFILTFSPGQLSRINGSFTRNDYSIFIALTHTLLNAELLPIYIATILATAIKWTKDKFHNIITSQYPWIAGIAAGYAITIYFGGELRLNWFTNLFVLAATLKLLYQTWGWFRRPHIILTMLLTILISIFFIGIAHWQRKVRENTAEIISAITSTPDSSVIYADPITESQLPWYTFGFVKTIFFQPFDMCELSYFYGHHGNTIVVLPWKYKGQLFDEQLKIPGTNPFYGIPPYCLSPDSTLSGAYRVVVGNRMSSMDITRIPWATWKNRQRDEWRDTLIVNIKKTYTGIDAAGNKFYIYPMPLFGRIHHGREIISIDR